MKISHVLIGHVMTSTVNKPPFATRAVQIAAMLASILAIPVTIAGVSHLAHLYKDYYIRVPPGQALPDLTMALLALSDGYLSRTVMVAIAGAIVCLGAAYFHAWSTTTAEACSVRLLALTSVVWVVCLLLLAIAMLAFALPFIDHFP